MKFLFFSLLYSICQMTYSQTAEDYHDSICADGHCIYGGIKNLTFPIDSDETTISIDMPSDISGILVDYENFPFGITGIYCGAYPITACSWNVSSINVTLNKGVDRLPHGTIVTITIETNKPYQNGFLGGYYFIHVDLMVVKE